MSAIHPEPPVCSRPKGMSYRQLEASAPGALWTGSFRVQEREKLPIVSVTIVMGKRALCKVAPLRRCLKPSPRERAKLVRSRFLSRQAFPPGEAARIYCAATRSSFTARTSISYSRPTIGGRAKCQLSPCDAAPRATRRSATKPWISCTV